MSRRVFVDCRWVGHTGLGRYVDSLMTELTQLDHGLSLLVGVLRSGDVRPPWLDSEGVDVVEIAAPWFTFGEQVEVARLLRRARVDLTHFTNFNVPLGYRGPCVTTVHDLTLLDYPTAGPAALDKLRFSVKTAAMQAVLRRSLRRPRLVVVPSEFVAGEVHRRFDVPRGAITVTHEAPAELPAADPDAVVGLGVVGPYVLSVGTTYPHKNLSRLLQAMERLTPASYPLQLVLVGPDDAHREAVRVEVAQRGLGSRVSVLGHVDESTLGALYRQADSYVFPSLSEGFGLPGLEAMSVGIPVASSSATCLPEVLGDAAIYFDPLDVDAMAVAMQRLHSDEELRQRLVEAGRRRAAAFTWRRTAEQTLGVYRRALADA